MRPPPPRLAALAAALALASLPARAAAPKPLTVDDVWSVPRVGMPVLSPDGRRLAKGLVDEARMAAAGGSYGGYLVNWVAGHTDRFKALVSHAGLARALAEVK